MADTKKRLLDADKLRDKAEARGEYTNKEWEAQPDEYLGECFKMCHGNALLAKGRESEFGVKGVYVCKQCGYAYPDFCEPARLEPGFVDWWE